MKNIKLTVILFSAAGVSFAQRAVDLKIYQNTDFFPIVNYNSSTQQSTQSEKINFNRFSLALALSGKKKLIHEAELFIPEIAKSIDHAKFPIVYESLESNSYAKITATSFSFRYEVSRVLHQSKRMAFSLGVGVNPYYTKVEYFPLTPVTYYRYLKKYGASLNVIPRVSYAISTKVRLDLNIPLKFFDLREEEQKIENPAIPIRYQTNGGLVHPFFENVYTIRFGVAYKI